MQYANNGSLLSYLDQHITKLTWKDKLKHLGRIASNLNHVHGAGLVHCDLHGGNIVLHDNMHKIELFICDLGLSQSVNSQSVSTIQSVLSFIAPEVFHTRKFTQKSDVYSFGIIMYLMATGETPFRDKQFNGNLAYDIMNGLRPLMPDSAPEEYKKLADRCCDADPDKRPDDGYRLRHEIRKLNIDGEVADDNTWNTIYHNEVKPLSCLAESKHSIMLLPTSDLPEPRNSHGLLLSSLFSIIRFLLAKFRGLIDRN